MKNFTVISAFIYMGTSLIASLLFFTITLAGNYSWVARIGGSAWVFVLAMIVSMPLVIPAVKKRMRV